MKQKTAAFRVDGYEISATFADSRNSDISRHLKHILLTSYAADTPKKRSGDILEVPAAQRYNDSGEGHRVPRKLHIVLFLRIDTVLHCTP